MTRKFMVISGGAGVIGRATVEIFARNGYDVAVLDFPHVVESEEIEKQLADLEQELQARIIRIGVDITNFTAVQNAFISLMKDHGVDHVNVLIHNAAKSIISLLEETDVIKASEVLDVLLKGALNLTVACLPLLKKAAPQSSIIAVSSIASLINPPFLGIYAAGKAGLEKLLESWRYELEWLGIHVGILHVGATRTGMVRRAYMSPTVKAFFELHDLCEEKVEKSKSLPCKAAKEFVSYVERPDQVPPETVAEALYRMVENRMTKSFVTKKDERQYRLARRMSFLSSRWFRNVSKAVLENKNLVLQLGTHATSDE